MLFCSLSAFSLPLDAIPVFAGPACPKTVLRLRFRGRRSILTFLAFRRKMLYLCGTENREGGRVPPFFV